MTREEEIEKAANESAKKEWGYHMNVAPHYGGFMQGAEWADVHPSDKTIMRVLNAIGYEDESWIEFVRKNWR